MATVSITLSQAEMGEAAKEYVARRYGLTPKTVHVTGGPTYGCMDRPTGGYTVEARVECEAAPVAERAKG